MSKIKAILFDMDGVLVDARDWHYEALNRALELFGYSIDRQSHLSTFDGLPTRRKLEILSSTQGLPIGLSDLINKLKQKYTTEIAYSRCNPNFDRQLALSRLKAEGYRVAVCSNSIRQSVITMMELSGLSEYIELILSNEDVTHPKPHPEIYTSAMNSLGVAPSECLIVEDNDHGYAAAVASGAHVMRVTGVEEVTLPRILQHMSSIGGN